MEEIARDLQRADLEELEDFSKAFPTKQKDNLLANENYFREHYRLKTMTDEFHERLTKTPVTDDIMKIIEDEPTYRIIEQEEYLYNF